VEWVAFSHDGRRLVTACSDPAELSRSAQIWDAATGRPLGRPMCHLDGVTHAEFSADDRRIATSGEDDCAMIWDGQTGQAFAVPLHHHDDVSHAFFSPDGRLLLTVSSDYAARVWDAATGEPVTPPLPHEGPVVFGAWRPDGREVATCSSDGTVRVWDVSPSPESMVQLKRQAELLSAHRLEANIGSVPLTVEEMKQRWQERKGR
jgi:WD40 repeat protein